MAAYADFANYIYQHHGQVYGPVNAVGIADLVHAGYVGPDTLLASAASESPRWFPARRLTTVYSPKSATTAVLLAFFLGALGAHWLYLGRSGLFILRLLLWVLAMGLIVGPVLVLFDSSTTDYERLANSMLIGYSLGGVIAVWTLIEMLVIGTKHARDGLGRFLC